MERTLAWMLLLVGVAIGAGPVNAERPLAFGVLNQQSPALTAERWNPILSFVTSVSGVPLQLKMGATVQETDALMGRGAFDFVFTNHNFKSEYDGTYSVIARLAGDDIRGIIAVPADSLLGSLSQLQGRKVAFPSADAFVAYAVPAVVLRKQNVTVREVFAGNQEGALAQLKARRVDGAAVNSRFLGQYMEREGVQFRSVYVSEAYPDLAVVVHPRVPAATVAKVRHALLGMMDDPAAGPILTRAKFKGFVSATDRDYDSVRKVYRLIGQ